MLTNIQLGDVPPTTDRALYVKAAIAAFQSILSNSALIQQLQQEDEVAIANNEDFDPWQNRAADLALECTDSLMRRLIG